MTMFESDRGWGAIVYDRRRHSAQVTFPADDPKAESWIGKLGPAPIARRVTVLFAPDSDVVRSVWVENASPIRGSDLSRTAWSRIIDAARTQRLKELEPSKEKGRRTDLFRLLGDLDEPKHPGRRGYSDDFYKGIGAAANEYRADGRIPHRVIAEEHGRDEKTVKNWIAEARRRGYALPGRSGRPPKRKDER